MRKQSFLRGAVILAAANSVSRILGLVYIIALPRIIQDAGMGLLQMVKPIYYFGVVLAVAGLPVAISKLVAEKNARNDTAGVLRVFYAAFLIMFVMGLLCTAVLWWAAPVVCEKLVKDPGAVLPLQAIAPSVVLLSIAAAFRGLFQGLQTMGPPALSQIVEQVARVGGMIVMATLLMPRGVEYGATGAALGSVLGAFAGCLVLLYHYLPLWIDLRRRPGVRKRGDGYGRILTQLLRLSFPIVLGAVMWPIMQMLDTAIVPARLHMAGFSAGEVRDLYGYYGMALSLMYFPNIITWALAVSLVPAISEAMTLKTTGLVKHRTQEAVRITVLFGLPAGVGLYLLADQMSMLLFGYVQVGAPLRILAIGSLFVGLYQTASGILQGLGRVEIPVRNLLVGVVVKFGLNWVLTAMPEFGVNGAAWGTTIGFTVATILNLAAIARHVGLTLDTNLTLKPLLASAVMGLGVPAVYRIARGLSYPWFEPVTGRAVALGNGIGVLAAVGVGVFVYSAIMLLTGGISRRQVEIFPKIGPRAARWLEARGFLR